MFDNIKGLLDQLKLIREVIQTKNLDKTGDLIESVAKLLGYAAMGGAVDDILDALQAKNYKAAVFALGTTIQEVSKFLPGDDWTPVPNPANGIGIGGVTTGATTSLTPCCDAAISALELHGGQNLTAALGPNDIITDPRTGLPIAVWIFILQAGWEALKFIRERRKNKQ